MWKRVLEFCGWVISRTWRYGVSKVRAIVAWAKANYRTVFNWMERGITFGTIVEWILRSLGIS